MGTAHLLRLLSLFTGISVLQQVRSWKIIVPTTVTAVEGSCVVVPCQTQPHSRVIWYRYHNIQYPVVYDGSRSDSVETQFRGRTSVLGKATEGNCTLMIRNVQKAENNLQLYVWINPESTANQKFHDQTVTIFVERKTPIISIQKQIVDGESFQANCRVKYTCPVSPPLLHWNINPFLENSTFMAFKEEVQGQWLYTETLQGIATYKMHNGNMRCSAQFETFTTESQQLTLNIFYKPITVTLIVEKEPIMEGRGVIMECAAECNPQPHTYSWLRRQMGQKHEINSTQRKMPFNNITRDTSLSCIAHNDIGAGQSDWLDMNVQYPPVILPKSSCHLTGEVLRCVCWAEASPNASIYWIVDGIDTLPSSFISVSTNMKNIVSGEIRGPAQSQTNVSCIATNSIGSDTKQLSIDNLSKTSFLLWLLTLMLLGIALLVGYAMFIYRKYFRKRPQSLLDNAQRNQTYESPQRPQEDDTQLSPCSPERNAEEDSLSCVYDNDFVEEMRRPTRQYQNNATLQREGKIQSLDKEITAQPCNMEIYLNC